MAQGRRFFHFLNSRSSRNNNNGWMMTVLASVPLVIYFRDRIGWVYRVPDGNSMHPILQDGDIVFVRKCSLSPHIASAWNKSTTTRFPGPVDDDDDEDDPTKDGNGNTQKEKEAEYDNHHQQQQTAEEEARLIRYERLHGISHPIGWFFQSVIPIPGQIIAYQNPCHYKREYFFHRVIGVGGQWLQRNYNNNNQQHTAYFSQQQQQSANSYYYRLELLPIYTVFVEGDNPQDSIDSRHWGPISRNLVAGVVEYIVWPPTRWQKLNPHGNNNNNNNPPSWKQRARWS